jgi:uncharacterized protein YraI/ATP-dependent protease ClpP protease subunit
MITIRALLCLALMLIGHTHLFAANITLVEKIDTNTGEVGKEILLQGEIIKGDLQKIKDIDNVAGARSLILSSPGGDFNEGLAIANFARESNLPTRIRSGDTCASACAFAFLGGSYSEDGTYAHRTLELGAKLLFHAPYSEIGETKVNVQDVMRKITNVTVELNRKFDEFEVPNSMVPLLLKNEKDHSLFDATTIEAIGLLDIRVEGFSGDGPVTKSVVENSCINGWRIGLKELPSPNRVRDVESFNYLSKETGLKLHTEDAAGVKNMTIQVQAVDIGEGTSGKCIINQQGYCSFKESEIKCSSFSDRPFLFAVPPDTKLVDANRVLADYRAKESDLFATAQPTAPVVQTQSIEIEAPQTQSNTTRFICNSKSSVSNIRSGPNPKSFPIVATFANGWPIAIVGSQKNPESSHVWMEVTTGNIRGYIDSDWVALECNPRMTASAKPVIVAICNKAADTTNVRSGPNAQNYPVVEVLRNGDKVELFYVTANPVTGHPWFNIKTRSTTGYVDSDKIGNC